MPSPAGAINTVTNQVWDEVSQSWIDATSTPDQTGSAIPVAYKVALEQAAPGVTTAVAEAQKPNESWADTLTRIMPNLVLGTQQIAFMFMNMDRARKGQPPIDANAYSGAYVNVGLDPNTQRLVTYAGLAILGLFVLNMATRK